MKFIVAMVPFWVCFMRNLPSFAAWWADGFARPALTSMAVWAEKIPFPLLEWGLIGTFFIILMEFCLGLTHKKGFPALFTLLRRLLAVGMAFAGSFCLLWLPLYHSEEIPAHSAILQQTASSALRLIDELNAAGYSLPGGLPAKTVSFPFWMDAFGISGLCSFLTGEALVHPEIDAVSLPFVAVHERMHLEGHAGEGAANIAAWRECLRRGGGYAYSARIWALKYTMGALYREDINMYLSCMETMNARTRESYRRSGGAVVSRPMPAYLQAVYDLLGISCQTRDYEILAAYLAAGLP